MNVREKIENFENLTLIKEATLSSKSEGRKIYEKDDDVETCFMIDRDRIIHCKSFRRLKHKTQVYIKTFGDHYRTRLTHTLEVNEIARTIAVGIGLNENLVEAISLGHDIGHVAFSHIGEEVLNDFLEKGFRHNEQSVRVVERLENNGEGLNLTKEVIDGILNHSGLRECEGKNGAKTLEGRIVQYSDKIAYINHDIDDSIRAKLLREENLPKKACEVLGRCHKDRVKTLVIDLINNSKENIKKGIIDVSFSKIIGEAMKDLREFMFENVYLSDALKEERDKARFILEQLIKFYMEYPEKMPELYLDIAKKEGKNRGVADYIAGMSDDYCLNMFNKIYIPKLVIY